ncbi:hypothetical protein GTA08_BOTSDO04901 [Neofusicoccum parvum]|uniref:Uncharacterized protein n=1 Tax=Neofusicoccum parvum TaxID=310453 RepID=A0ACB5SKL4_9PEZI|nr:hypothetical protein GTA08_BOTSDO04901 [Neofusicoccum parvum]
MSSADELSSEEVRTIWLCFGLILGTGILSLIVCTLRLYARIFLVKQFGADDISVVVSLVIVQTFNGLGLAIVHYGSGKSMVHVSQQDLLMWFKLYYVAMCMYLYVALSVKISLLLFQRRLFPNAWLQRITMGLMIFLTLFTISGSFALAFQCQPVKAGWDKTITDAKCFSTFTVYQITLYQAILIFITDVAILIMPMPLLYKLNMRTGKKIAIIFIFGSGIIACISPAVRFSTLNYLLEGSVDVTYSSTSSLYWMAIEFNLGLVAGSLSSLRALPVLRRFGSTFGNSYVNSEGYVNSRSTASSTDFDDILNKPSSFDEDASQRDAELLPERRPHPSRISGWRVGALGAAIITICVMLFNVAITTWIMTHPDYRDDDDGWRIMFEGSCQTAKKTSRWVHFLINAISTLLLGASNYCMQVLSSPTRSELVRAHSRKIWLHIGVPNTRNLWHIGKDRSLLWILLFLSSVPLHFIFNSVIFANIQANEYAVLPATPSFLNGGEYNTTGFFGFGDSEKEIFASSATDIRTKFEGLLSAGNKTENLTTAECLSAYNNQYISKYGDVLLVQDEVIWRNRMVWAPSYRFENGTLHDSYFTWTDLTSINFSTELLMFPGSQPNLGDNIFPFRSYPDEYPASGWLCPSRSVESCSISSSAEVPDRNTWAPYGHAVSHCVAELVAEQCRLQFSSRIAAAVIACNVVKAACVVALLVRSRHHHLVTLGDAIACFLAHPDPATRGRGLHGKALLVKEWTWMATHGHADPKRIAVEPERWAPPPRGLRWARAASKRRWWATYALYGGGLAFAGTAIARSLAGMPRSPAALWAVGFGELRGNNLLALSASTTGSIVLANTPQALLSYLYVAFNALASCMLVAREWARYAAVRKPLRVSSPLGRQRSTYWLQLPYRYALPLAVASALLHWLASQALFMVSVTILDGDRRPAREIATCGYSPVAVILATVVGSVVVLAGLVMAARRYPATMPLAGSCSAAISAACHPPSGDECAALLPVQWGVVKEEGGEEVGRDGVGHVTFTSFEVTPPLWGRRYA